MHQDCPPQFCLALWETLGGNLIPTPVAINDVLQTKFFCSSDVQNGINAIGYRVTGLTVPGVTDQDVADSLSAAASVVYKAYLSNTTMYRGLTLQIVRPAIRPYVTSVILAGLGAIVDVGLPNQVALLLSPRTATAGRSGRGRTYLPFWNEGDNDADRRPSVAAITKATNWSNAIFAVRNITVGASTATITPVIISRVGIPTERVVTEVRIRSSWATQRRRSLINKPDVLGP